MFFRLCSRLLCASLIAGLAWEASGGALPTHWSFDAGSDGWKNQAQGIEAVQSEWLPNGGRNGTGGIHIRSAKSDSNGIWIWRCILSQVPKDKALRISGWVKGRGVETLVAICVQGWDAGRKSMGDFATTQAAKPLRGDFDWTQIETYLRPSPQTEQVHVLIFLQGKGEVWFDDVAVEEADPAKAPVPAGPSAPGLCEARGEWKVSGTSPRPTVRIPLPLAYREQVPLTYEMSTEPAGGLVGVRVYRDRLQNYVAEVVLKRLEASDKVNLRWTAIVLCAPRSFDNVPKASSLKSRHEGQARWPAEARPWLKSTRCVQSDDKRIQDVGKEIRGDCTDVIEIIQKTLERTKRIYAGQKGRAPVLDAVHALDKQGSCTSCANLVAALLRANGIPARILAGYPTWCGALQTHYIVEAFVPDYGWYPIESTRLQAPWAPYQQIEVAIIPPEHEDRSEGRPFAADGVPYLSLNEYPGCDGKFTVWGNVDAARSCDHGAKVWRAFPPDAPAKDWETALAEANRCWTKWLESPPRLDAQHRLATPLQPASLDARDPEELAKFLGKAEKSGSGAK